MTLSEDPISLFIEFIILPLIVIFLYDLMRFRKSYYNLCDEIDENFLKIQESEVNRQFQRMRDTWIKNKQNLHQNEWIGFGKRISIWILANKIDTTSTDYYRYLSNNELKNFIQSGNYGSIERIEENLTLYYIYCERLSVITQDIEKIINNEFRFNDLFSKPDEVQQKFVEDKIHAMQVTIEAYRSTISEEYNNIHPVFRKGIIQVIRLYFS
jgi:hypothetical protein